MLTNVVSELATRTRPPSQRDRLQANVDMLQTRVVQQVSANGETALAYSNEKAWLSVSVAEWQGEQGCKLQPWQQSDNSTKVQKFTDELHAEIAQYVKDP